MMWIKFQHKDSSHVFLMVCYFPPIGSSRDVDVEELFPLIRNQVQSFTL